MPEIYTGLKWLHIVGVCIAFGSNVTHFFWLLSANRDPVNRANIVRLVKKIDDRLAVPSYVVAITCGISMWLWQWPLDAAWLIASLVLTVGLTIWGIAFGPFMKRWIALTSEPEPNEDKIGALSKRLTSWWAVIIACVFVITYLMVWKPALW
jgi:uncharacterized membrane protein